MHSWAKLDRLIEHLPPRSRFKLAILDDDDWADQAIQSEDDLDSTTPSLQDWTPEVGYLASVVDRLGDVVTAIVATAPKGKPPKIKPVPRPKTALDRARSRRSVDRHLSLVAEVEEARVRRQALSD